MLGFRDGILVWVTLGTLVCEVATLPRLSAGRSEDESSIVLIHSSHHPPTKQQSVDGTTLSPEDIMNRLYQMHGMGGLHPTHDPKDKKQDTNKAMDDIYRLHGAPNKDPPSDSQQSSIEHIYQQHSAVPSSMHHILAQHSQPQNSRPQQQQQQPVRESSPATLSNFVQPLLKQLTPVGAGIGVILAPLLLFNGLFQFFGNMSKFLNNFAQTILPVRRPQGEFLQHLGPEFLQRQPRDWYLSPENAKDFHELILKIIQQSEKNK